jgi:RHS repeat-associated protein
MFEDNDEPGKVYTTINNVMDYYPYGKILREYRSGDEERYLTTQHERDIESGLDYRGARYYDSEVSRFLSIDPLASKFPAWSTYNYVMGNPIMFTDPTGREAEDNFKLSKDGNITLTEKTDDDFDVLSNEDNSKSIKLDKGIIGSKSTNERDLADFGKQSYDMFEAWGEKNGNNFFEFVAQNTNVEWSILKFGEDGMRTNIITTSHKTGAEFGNGDILSDKFTMLSDFKEWTHSHPNGRMIPSGAQYPLYLDEFRKGNDIGTANYLDNSYQNKIKTQIYNPLNNTYFEYNSQTYIPE